MKFNPFADMGLQKKQEFPKQNAIVTTAGGFNPKRYYDKSQIDAILAGFVPNTNPGASGYTIANGPQDDGDYVYVGLLNSNTGAWYIYRRTEATDVRQYAAGSSNYSTNWTNRESLSYS